MIDIPDNERFLSLGEVMHKTSKGRTSIYTDPNFPKPVKISTNRVAWRETEVRGWMAQRIGAANQMEAA